jgi:hypothetical protein
MQGQPKNIHGRDGSLLPLSENEPNQLRAQSENDQTVESAALLPLFRLLIREPPPDHDFNTCPVCKRHGITSI